jgi:HK97 family phage prohead protease
MPAIKCDNGKWKWGENGSCIYETEQDANDDNENYYRDLKDIDLTPTQGMIEEAKKGLEWRKEFGRGGTEVGVRTARMIINNELTIPRIKKMYAYFSRHEVDKQAEGFDSGEDGYPSAGRIAWALWGGDAGQSWSTKKRNQINNEMEKNDLDKRHIKKVIEDDETITIIYGKSQEWEGIDIDMENEPEEIIDGPEEIITENYYDDEDKKNERSEKVWDKTNNNITMEKRVFNIESRIEESEDKNLRVVGHASLYNTRSEDLGGFYEYIQEGAFTPELIAKSDVRALINHDPNLVLARSTAGTLTLTADSKGLRYEFPIPNTTYGHDLAENLRNGNITQSSFAFTVGADEWSTDDEGRDVRTITEIDRLYDISSVTYPAYQLAESELLVAKRGHAAYKDKIEMKKEETFLVQRSLAKLKIELAKRK